MKESDLVVIASPVSTDAVADKFTEHSWPVEFVGQITTFRVVQALKGATKAEQFKVLHFKFGEPKKGVKRDEAAIIVDGPSFVTFTTKGVRVKVNRAETFVRKAEFLLFLKEMKDGRYEPVTGRVDPAFSVRQLLPASAGED